jgi:hypothetical protein
MKEYNRNKKIFIYNPDNNLINIHTYQNPFPAFPEIKEQIINDSKEVLALRII